MDIVMPAAFPEQEFRAFLVAARAFLPAFLSYETLEDPWERFWQFDRSWQAVRYRYRICSEANEEFRAFLANADDAWKEGRSKDEEFKYQLERCIYMFFMSAVSVFESFGFCLYFVGNAIRPGEFQLFAQPKRINLDATTSTFVKTFPKTRIAQALSDLLEGPPFRTIYEVRNVLAHRVGGRRSVTTSGIVHRDATVTSSREEVWYMPGMSRPLQFSETLQELLNSLTIILTRVLATT
jgi:hypothetical protein